MSVKIIILSERRQKKVDTVWFHLYNIVSKCKMIYSNSILVVDCGLGSGDKEGCVGEIEKGHEETFGGDG